MEPKLNQISLALEKNSLPHFTTRPGACVGPILLRILNGGMVTSDIHRAEAIPPLLCVLRRARERRCWRFSDFAPRPRKRREARGLRTPN
jgi:hypothetical protein